MKKLFIITIIIIQTSILFAQNQQITRIWGNPSKDENGAQVFEVNNNTFFVTLQRDYNIGNIYTESIILKLDSNLNIIDSLKLMKYNNRGLKYSLSDFFYYNNRIIAKGYAYDSSILKSQIWLSEFDEDLTMLYDTILTNSDTNALIFNYDIIKTTQNNLLITSQYVPILHDSINTMVWLLDTTFKIIRTNEFYTKVGFFGFSVVEVPSVQSFHIITQNEITKISSISLSYDTVVWQVADPDSQWEGVGGSKTINDSTYLQPRRYPFLDNNVRFGFNTYLYNRNKNGAIKDSILIGDMQKSYIKTSYNNFDFFTPDSIFVSGTNELLDSSNASNGDNTIFLWNISINGSINWQKYYSSPGMKFILHDITKTSDGGCFLTGVAWNWHLSNIDTTDIFFLKIDRNGIISGTQGINEIITQSEIRVYPNPANDKLFIELNEAMEGMASIEIYDLNARLCYNTNINTAQKLQMIDISSVKKGIYNIRITTKNKSENQKLVIIK